MPNKKSDIQQMIDALDEMNMLNNPIPEDTIWRWKRRNNNIDYNNIDYNNINSEPESIRISDKGNANLFTNHDLNITDLPNTDWLDEEIKQYGMEVLAWYRSYHWEKEKAYPWGIYITESGIYHIAKQIFLPAKLTTIMSKPFDIIDILEMSFKLLFIHEYFHFLTDIAATILEISNYSFSIKVSKTPKKYYTDYFREVYLHGIISGYRHEPLEEAMANAFTYSHFRGGNIRFHIRQFMETQPNGYSQFYNYISQAKFNSGKRKLSGYIINSSNFDLETSILPMEQIFDTANSSVSFSEVPIFLIQSFHDVKLRIGIIKSIAEYEFFETDKFKKELSKLPKRIIDRFYFTKKLMTQNVKIPSLNFEKLHGGKHIFTVRVNDNYRVALKRETDRWLLLNIGTHDYIYKIKYV